MCVQTKARSRNPSVPALSPVNSARQRVRRRRPCGRRLVHAHRDADGVQQPERQHDREDPQQDVVGLAQVAAAEPLGPQHLPDEERHPHADDHEHHEQVLQEAEPGGVPDERDGERGREDVAERLQDRRQQDQEPPEDECVHHAGTGALQQLPLTEHHGRLGLHALTDVVGPPDRAAELHQAEEEAPCAGRRSRPPGPRRRRGSRGRPPTRPRAARRQPIRPSRSASLWSGRKVRQRRARPGSGRRCMTIEVRQGIHRLTRGVVNFYLVEDGGPSDARGRRARAGTGTSSPRGSPRSGAPSTTWRPSWSRTRTATTRGSPSGPAWRARPSGSTRPTPRPPVARSRGRTRPAPAGTCCAASSTAPSRTSCATGERRIVPILRALDVRGRRARRRARPPPRAPRARATRRACRAVLLEDRRALLTGDALVTRNPLTGRRGPQIMPSGLNRDSQQALALAGRAVRDPGGPASSRATATPGRARLPRRSAWPVSRAFPDPPPPASICRRRGTISLA